MGTRILCSAHDWSDAVPVRDREVRIEPHYGTEAHPRIAISMHLDPTHHTFWVNPETGLVHLELRLPTDAVRAVLAMVQP